MILNNVNYTPDEAVRLAFPSEALDGSEYESHPQLNGDTFYGLIQFRERVNTEKHFFFIRSDSENPSDIAHDLATRLEEFSRVRVRAKSFIPDKGIYALLAEERDTQW